MPVPTATSRMAAALAGMARRTTGVGHGSVGFLVRRATSVAERQRELECTHATGFRSSSSVPSSQGGIPDAIPDDLNAIPDAEEQIGARTFQLFAFDDGPRGVPPGLELEGAWSERHVRAVQRAASHPWRDARFWRDVAAKIAEVPTNELVGSDVAQVCLSFRKVGFSSTEFAKCCERQVDERRHKMNVFELGCVASYYASAHGGLAAAQEIIKLIADEVCIEWRTKETVPWSAWRMLVTSAAETQVAHQQLFAMAGPHLAKSVGSMVGRDVVDVAGAYAAMRLKHNELLAEIARFVPSMGLTDREVDRLRQSFEILEYDAPLLLRYAELRLPER